VLLAVERVERVRRQDLLADPPAVADVHHRHDRRVRVELDRGRDASGPPLSTKSSSGRTPSSSEISPKKLAASEAASLDAVDETRASPSRIR
jgi:hypothetical protein